MAIHAPGPRLFRSIPFKHLAKGDHGGAKNSNVSLNLTPFVDMMTILVTFLLMVFSADTLLSAQKGLQLPRADQKSPLQEAPIIIVTKSEITYQGTIVATVESVLRDDSPTFKIDPLFELLDAKAKQLKENPTTDDKLAAACEARKQGRTTAEGPQCPESLAVLQADESIDARVINKIVITAKAAGFDNLQFAVEGK